MRQRQVQRLEQKLSPQQVQLMKLILLPTAELEGRIKQELEDNPALAEGSDETLKNSEDQDLTQDDWMEDRERPADPDFDYEPYLSDDQIPEYKLYTNNRSADQEDYEAPVVMTQSFYEDLREQLSLRNLDELTRQIAEYLVGNLDDQGYLRRDLTAIADDLAFNVNLMVEPHQIEEALKALQELDPPGIGARDLRECLLLQLNRKAANPATELAKTLLDSHFDEFTKKHFDKLMARLSITEDQLRAAIEVITHLNPKPGGTLSQSGGSAGAVTPDFLVTIEEGEIMLNLNARQIPELSVSRDYREMIESYRLSPSKNREQKAAVLFARQKVDSARWFIDAIRQRQETLLFTMSAIIERQREYFLTGDKRMIRPMILKDIAERIGMDISTVSRVASNKYVQTPYGTFLIKELFSESMTNEQGEEVSTTEIKKILEDALGDEDKRHPLTDDALAILLKEKGYPIARRTVAKYREQLGQPVARLRKIL
jgi:RNA polymerase sigma-54 factor